MYTLLHFPLCPFSRKIRLALAEKGIAFGATIERPWERREEFLMLNPASEVPVLIDDEQLVIAHHNAISEFLEEGHPEPSLLGATLEDRAEVRRLVGWFDDKFNREVTENLVGEKLIKRLSSRSQPHGPAIRAGLTNIRHHLDYIAFLADRRTWLAGDTLSLADLAAAAHLSTVDYLGDVPWDSHGEAKDWYARIKSRPSFRALLADAIPGIPPPRHYADLDF
ncbi:MAG: glutathione S-transferase family protein [Azospirillaceae bacterium]|nr:glutathione S-transferase family protein [Azospirillaceae bacterium]